MNLSGVTALDNKAAVYFRLADNSTVSANGTLVVPGGTDRVDNVEIAATAMTGVTGACCISGSCIAGIAPADCAAVGGRYNGNGSTCVMGLCQADMGACCQVTSCSIQPPAACAVAGGTYRGDGTSCTPNPCLFDMTIGQAKSYPPGTPLRIANVILSSTQDLVNSASDKTLHVQDATGGLTVWGTNADIDALLGLIGEGDQTTLEGRISPYDCLAEFVAPFNTPPVLGHPGEPAPIVVTAADFANGSLTAEALESKLVRVNCLTIDPNSVGANWAYGTYTATDSTGVLVIRIATRSIPLVGTPIPTGTFDMIGIFGQFDTSGTCTQGYQLQPRYPADQIIAPGCVECPPGGVSEGEPACGDGYVDTYNGGCDSEPPVFSGIAPGETVCGQSGTYLLSGSEHHDTDWYQYVSTECLDFAWTVRAEFPVQIAVIDGSAGCDAYQVVASASGDACTDVIVTTGPMGTGTYWFSVSPSVLTSVPCGLHYSANLSSTDPPPLTIMCPPPIDRFTAPGRCDCNVQFVALATGCPAVTIKYAIAGEEITSPHVFPQGWTRVWAKATDSLGRQADCWFDVTITDNEPPHITPPPDLLVRPDPNVCYATNVPLGAPQGLSDNCAPLGSIVVSNDAPAQFLNGDTWVHWSATDPNGNVGSAPYAQLVTVSPVPFMKAPPSIRTLVGPNSCFAPPLDVGGTYDLERSCGVEIRCSPDPTRPFPVGVTKLTWTFEDDASQFSAGDQFIDVLTSWGCIAGAMKRIRNTTAHTAYDFHADFWLPTWTSAHDFQADEVYGAVHGFGGNPPAWNLCDGLGAWDQDLRVPILSGSAIRLYYIPGSVPLLDNLREFYWTDANHNQIVGPTFFQRLMRVLAQFSAMNDKSTSSLRARFRCYNDANEPIVVSNLQAWKDIDMAYWFDLGNFQGGPPVSVPPTPLTVPVGGSFTLDLGQVAVPDTYAWLVGDVALESDPNAVEDFGTAYWPGRLNCAGDTNCDGRVTFADIDPFVAALGSESAWDQAHPNCPWTNADCNGDFNVTFADIDPFVALIGTTCP